MLVTGPLIPGRLRLEMFAVPRRLRGQPCPPFHLSFFRFCFQSNAFKPWLTVPLSQTLTRLYDSGIESVLLWSGGCKPSTACSQ